MGWCTTRNLTEFRSAADAFLRSRPAENTLLLSAASELSAAGELGDGVSVPSDALFGWLEQADGIRGAFVHLPPDPVLVGSLAPEAAAALADALARLQRRLGGIDASVRAAEAFAATWKQRTRQSARVHRHTRVYRLTGPVPDVPSAPGRFRPATADDKDVVAEWLAAFGREVGDVPHPATADELLSRWTVLLWETPGVGPTAMTVLAGPVAGTVRIMLVYTPPRLRHLGYASAVLVAACRAAREAGATDALMITDVSSPMTGTLRQRLGCEPLGDRLVLTFR
jgi:predicted GNAT family acetyltransferase